MTIFISQRQKKCLRLPPISQGTLRRESAKAQQRAPSKNANAAMVVAPRLIESGQDTTSRYRHDTFVARCLRRRVGSRGCTIVFQQKPVFPIEIFQSRNTPDLRPVWEPRPAVHHKVETDAPSRLQPRNMVFDSNASTHLPGECTCCRRITIMRQYDHSASCTRSSHKRDCPSIAQLRKVITAGPPASAYRRPAGVALAGKRPGLRAVFSFASPIRATAGGAGVRVELERLFASRYSSCRLASSIYVSHWFITKSLLNEDMAAPKNPRVFFTCVQR